MACGRITIYLLVPQAASNRELLVARRERKGQGGASQIEGLSRVADNDVGYVGFVEESTYLRPNLGIALRISVIFFHYLDLRGGVVGRLEPLPWTYFCFFSAGFRICGNVSNGLSVQFLSDTPGKSTASSRQHSS